MQNDNTVQAKPAQTSSGFKPRLFTSVVYVAVWIALAAMKWTLPGGWGALGFDALFCAISIIGSFEFLRAIGGISVAQRSVTLAFAAIIVPLYVIVQMTMGSGFLAVACAFTVYVMFLMASSVFNPNVSTVKGTISCVFCMLYCGVLSVVLSSINHLETNSMAAILMLFMATVLCDTGAYVIGSLFKRFIPIKLSPRLSPNKTVIGAVGGILGGILGGVLAYLLIRYIPEYNGVALVFTSTAIHPVVSFILIGLATSILAQVGDLFESAIKRECGIKDMGNLLPGHGGILDRFDSMLYCSVVVLLSFGTIIF